MINTITNEKILTSEMIIDTDIIERLKRIKTIQTIIRIFYDSRYTRNDC